MIAMADRSRRPLMSVTSLCLPPCFCGKLKLEEAFIDASFTRAKRLAVGPTRRGNGKELDPNQKRLRNRLLVLLGHTNFVDRDYSRALEEYKRAITFRPTDYYAHGVVAQCLECLEDASARGILGAMFKCNREVRRLHTQTRENYTRGNSCFGSSRCAQLRE
jgi:hypothetical protein